MKCDLCASLLHNPPLLFLDEPTIGLDVSVKERIRDFIRYINRTEGSTIVLTTHDMTDIEELCERIIIVDKGKIIFDGPTNEIRERFGRWRRIVVDLDAPVDIPDTDLALLSGDLNTELQKGEFLRFKKLDSKHMQISFDRTRFKAGDVISNLLATHTVNDLELHEPDLSDIIREIYDGGIKV
jgi:ABC-2 type transport system ATP-binding protein